MATFFDQAKGIPKSSLVIDTNVLISCFSNKSYFIEFTDVFSSNQLLLDPIVKLEFLRGTFAPEALKEKETFLNYEKFIPMIDHQQIYKKVYDNAFKISRFFAKHGRNNMSLGDIFIMSRLASYVQPFPFLTLDSDFSDLLFDRINVVSIEKETKLGSVLEHINILILNTEKLSHVSVL